MAKACYRRVYLILSRRLPDYELSPPLKLEATESDEYDETIKKNLASAFCIPLGADTAGKKIRKVLLAKSLI